MNFSVLYKSIMNYGIYHETVHGKIVEPVPMFWNFISGIIIGMPFQLFQIQALIVSFLTNLLNISGSLKSVQVTMMNNAKTIFLGFIGGSNGTIAQASGAGMLLAITGFYLFYQYTNGKGNFMRSFIHLMAVVATMFFFFGNFTVRTPNGQFKTEMGGQILFDTVTNVADTAKKEINNGMTGFSNAEQSGDFIENYVVKPTANFINTGNPAGVVDSETGKTFDYDKAKGSGGQAYVDDLAKGSKGNPYLKNDGKQLGFQIAAGVMGGMNLWIYSVPIIAVNSTISALSLLVCVFIILIPLSALLSFIPWFRNAFFTTIKTTLGLLVAPSILSVMLGFLFFLMTQIDYGVLSLIIGKPQTNLEAAVSGLGSIEFLIFLPVVFILKIVFMIVLWKNRSGISQKILGTNMAAGNAEFSHMKMEWEQFKRSFKKNAEGGAKIATGVATENPALIADGASMVAPNMTNGFNRFQDMKEQRSEEVFEPEIKENKEETSENMQVDEIPSEESQEIEVSSEAEMFPDEVDSLEPEHTENFISEENQTIETLETEETDEPVDVQNLQDDSLVETSFAMEETPVNDEAVIDEKDLISWEEASHDLQEVRI
ncbi:hypothetical protein QR692_02070 [Lactococcus petauri]|uniref:hypothetical protein n=1 Tax=Lactococcus petauri TaxID=1940789 RepID=UPI002078E381|nr:hypothetical protein [Lactococcus petauri]USI68522.1 hypothetical protein LMK04_02025 [Lactococcus petauri]WJE13199.1 hypothetical protein QR692_02070 [Lactococcus petauri]